MRILCEWIHRRWGTLRPGRRDADLEQELRLHLELAAEDAPRRGDTDDDAVRAALIEAGGASRAMDSLRDQRGLPWLDDLAPTCALACARCARSPVLELFLFLTYGRCGAKLRGFFGPAAY